MDLNGKTALVTGGGTGLGKVVSLKLARAGVDVALCYTRSAAEAEETVREIQALGRRALAVQADVSRDAEACGLVDEAARALGRLDILVNAAGTTVFVDFKKLEDVREEDWDRLMAVNVKGAFFCARAAAPHLRASGAGKVVNVTSVSGLRAGGSSIPYAVSKAAETMLTKCLALSLAPEVCVNAVAPGLMETRWWGSRLETAREGAARGAPLQRVASLDDVADTVLFLIRSDSMTGQSVVVDGGFHMH